MDRRLGDALSTALPDTRVYVFIVSENHLKNKLCDQQLKKISDTLDEPENLTVPWGR